MSDSTRTKGLGIRITHTQYRLLNTPKYMGKASALVRVLLEMYFNGKIPEVDLFLKHEVKLAKEYVNLHNGKNSTPRVKPIKKP